MSSPSGQNFQQFAKGGDAGTLIKNLRRDLDALRRDFNQRNASQLGWAVTTPPLPATTVAVVNTNPVPVTVYARGGTITNAIVDGVTILLQGGSYRVKSGGTIALTYTGSPTWQWYGD
jgi:hypothetical protein